MFAKERLSAIDASGRQISLLNSDSSSMVDDSAAYNNRPLLSPIDVEDGYCSSTQLSPAMGSWNLQPEESVSSGSSGNNISLHNGSGKRKYHCTESGCNKSFTTSGHLARHNRIHTGEKNFPCLFPGCQSRFSRQDNMMQHYRTHMSPKSRKSNKRAAPPEDTRPKPRLHAHHRISSDPFGVERPLTIDQHLSNYHRSLVSTERFSCVRYDGSNGSVIKTSSAESTATSPPSVISQQTDDNTTVHSMFYQHRPLTFLSSTPKHATTTLLGPSPNETRFPIPSNKTRQQRQPHDEDIDLDDDSKDGDRSERLLKLAHVVSTFG
ncbi:hypothetical protein BX666DRAFT_1952563 [Dichotomocladium elegans]|nr:hypothetical protein BX666DRAFT_1952563 [Dichotomocladium elegans]